MNLINEKEKISFYMLPDYIRILLLYVQYFCNLKKSNLYQVYVIIIVIYM